MKGSLAACLGAAKMLAAAGARLRGDLVVAAVADEEYGSLGTSNLIEHVTTDAGTGLVHTAPAHGVDDFNIGKKYGLPVDNPVGDDGHFLQRTAPLPTEPLAAFLPRMVFSASAPTGAGKPSSRLPRFKRTRSMPHGGIRLPSCLPITPFAEL